MKFPPKVELILELSLKTLFGISSNLSLLAKTPQTCVFFPKEMISGFAVKENLVENARIVGEYLLDGLKKLAQEFPDKITAARGRGLMCAINLPSGAARDKLRDILYDDGLIILACGDHSIRFRPHLNVTKEEIQMALDKIANNIGRI